MVPIARCNCGAQTCGCRLVAGENVTLTGSGTARDPWVIEAAAGGEGGATGWSSGDRKETYRSDTPGGWLECNGQAVSRATYAALYAAVGTRFGPGDGVNTFNLPNETGRVSIGAGPGYPQDATGGQAATTLVTANLPPHTHTINHDHPATTSSANGGHSHNIVAEGNALEWQSKAFAAGNEEGVRKGGDSGFITASTVGNHTHSVNVPAYTGPSGSTGSGASFTNLPPYRAIRVLIKT